MRLRLVLLALALLLPSAALADPGGAEDADAGDDAATATPLGPGEHAGVVADGDDDDWFLVAHPEGLGVRATLRVAHGPEVWVRMLAPDGEAMADDVAQPTVDGEARGHEEVSLEGGHADGHVLLALTTRFGSPPVEYVLVVEHVELPDLAVARVEVRGAPLATRAGDAPVSWAREVEVEVENRGPVEGSARLAVSALAAGPRASNVNDLPETFGRASVRLAPGERLVLVLPWNATGHAGDVDVTARLSFGWGRSDADHASNARTVRTSSYAGGAGVGLTVMDGWIHCWGGFREGVCWWMEGRAEGFDAFVAANEAGLLVLVDADVRTQGATVRACTNAVVAGECRDRWGRAW